MFPPTLLVIFVVLWSSKIFPCAWSEGCPEFCSRMRQIIHWTPKIDSWWNQKFKPKIHLLLKSVKAFCNPWTGKWLHWRMTCWSDESRVKTLWISSRKYSIVLFVMRGNQNLYTHSCVRPLLGIHSWTKNEFTVHEVPCSCFWYPFQIQITRNKSTEMKWRSIHFISSSPAWGVFFWQKWLFTYLFRMRLKCPFLYYVWKKR
jgi:hypothetical protein